MKKNFHLRSDHEIYLFDLIKILLRKKFLILAFSIFNGLLLSLILASKSNTVKIEFLINSPPKKFFSGYVGNNLSATYLNEYSELFYFHILNPINKRNFLKENNKLDDLRNHLKLNNISETDYVQKVQIERLEKNSLDIPNLVKMSFDLPEKYADLFVENYLEFIKKKTRDEIKLEIERFLEERQTEEVDKLILKKNLIQSTKRDSQNNLSTNYLENVMDSEQYRLVLIDYKSLIERLRDDQFNYDHIFYKKYLNKSIYQIFFINFIIGFALSIIISFFIVIFKFLK